MKTAYYWSCLARSVLGACLAAAVASAYAQQSYPTRPVRIIVPSSAGGGTDTTTRLVLNKLGELLGQRVVIENRAGAASIVGSEIVARSAPDGYTLLAAISTITMVHVPYKGAGQAVADLVAGYVPFMRIRRCHTIRHGEVGKGDQGGGHPAGVMRD